MSGLRALGLACLLACAAGCENAEEKARYVKAPLEAMNAADRDSLNAAVSEARTRLVTVRDRQLRAALADDIDDTTAARWRR